MLFSFSVFSDETVPTRSDRITLKKNIVQNDVTPSPEAGNIQSTKFVKFKCKNGNLLNIAGITGLSSAQKPSAKKYQRCPYLLTIHTKLKARCNGRVRCKLSHQELDISESQCPGIHSVFVDVRCPNPRVSQNNRQTSRTYPTRDGNPPKKSIRLRCRDGKRLKIEEITGLSRNRKPSAQKYQRCPLLLSIHRRLVEKFNGRTKCRLSHQELDINEIQCPTIHSVFVHVRCKMNFARKKKPSLVNRLVKLQCKDDKLLDIVGIIGLSRSRNPMGKKYQRCPHLLAIQKNLMDKCSGRPRCQVNHAELDTIETECPGIHSVFVNVRCKSRSVELSQRQSRVKDLAKNLWLDQRRRLLEKRRQKAKNLMRDAILKKRFVVICVDRHQGIGRLKSRIIGLKNLFKFRNYMQRRRGRRSCRQRRRGRRSYRQRYSRNRGNIKCYKLDVGNNLRKLKRFENVNKIWRMKSFVIEISKNRMGTWSAVASMENLDTMVHRPEGKFCLQNVSVQNVASFWSKVSCQKYDVSAGIAADPENGLGRTALGDFVGVSPSSHLEIIRSGESCTNSKHQVANHKTTSPHGVSNPPNHNQEIWNHQAFTETNSKFRVRLQTESTQTRIITREQARL